MELTKQYIHMNREKGKASTQLALDDDFNVPDNKPDVLRMIQDKAQIKILETNITQGHVWIKGIVQFWLLYRSDGEERKINSLSGELPFQESLVIDGIDEYDTVKVRWQIEDLSIGIINSRKLSIKALVELSVIAGGVYDEEVVTGIMAEEQIETLESTQTVMQLFYGKKDTYRFKEEITLPSNKPNIREILWRSVQLRGVETRLLDGQIMLKGEALIFVLYLGEEEEERLQWLETALPFSTVMDCNGCTMDMILDISHEIAVMELEAKPDYDGEERMLHFEMVLDLDIHIYQEEQVQLLEDLYGINCRLQLEYESAVFENLLLKNFSKCKVNDRISIGENQEGILQLCASEGSVSIENSEIVAEGIQVEGTMGVQILYITAEDRNPLASLKEVIPFHYLIEVPGITKNTRYQLEACLEQLTIVMLDSTQVEVKGIVNLNSIVFEQKQVERLTEVQIKPLDMQELQERPGIVGYIARAGERLWDIAKANDTTIDNIKETNHLTANTLTEGEKILIIKTVM